MKLKISIATIKKMIHIVGFDLHLHSPFEKKKKVLLCSFKLPLDHCCKAFKHLILAAVNPVHL